MPQYPHPPLVADPRPGPGGWVRLQPIADEHRERSAAMIRRAADLAPTGRAIVLGAGELSEIPLDHLTRRFESVSLLDIDPASISAGLARVNLPSEALAKLSLLEGDLVGLRAALTGVMTELLGIQAGASEMLDALCERVAGVMPAAMDLMRGGRAFEFIAASAVLSQLYKPALDEVTRLFTERFPDRVQMMREHRPWIHAVELLAARAEAAFMEAVEASIAEGGVLYLAATTRFSYIHLTGEGHWASKGFYRMTARGKVSDYVPQAFEVVEEANWPWVAAAPRKAGEVGNLYAVEAIIGRKRHG